MSAQEFRIDGPPGTGKTTFIRNQVEAWSDRYAPEEIVLCSFSRAAAKELAGAVSLPRDNVATIHALAYRMWDRPPIAETGALAKEWNALCYPEWRVGDGAIDLEEGVEPSKDHGKQMALYNLARARLEDNTDYWKQHPMVKEWQRFKDEHGALDFADMINLSIDYFPELISRPRVLMVDEAQDLTPAQWRLVRSWGAADSVEQFLVAGDADQVIYSFAGARPDEFMDGMPELLAAGYARVLSRSYRTPRTVHALAQRWIEQIPGRAPKAFAARDAEGTVAGVDATWRYVDGIVACATRHLDQGQTVMILASCAYMLAPVIAALREEGLPFYNPYRRTNGAWNPLGGGRADAVSTVARYLAFLEPLSASGPTWSEIARWGVLLPARHYLRGMKTKIVTYDRREGSEESVRPLLLRELSDIFHLGAMAHVVNHDSAWLVAEAMESYKRPLTYAHAIYQKGGAALLRQTPRLVIGTIHSVKGGEADVVILMPDISLEAYRQAVSAQEHQDSITRLFYVGITRAKEALYVTAPVVPMLAAQVREWVP